MVGSIERNLSENTQQNAYEFLELFLHKLNENVKWDHERQRKALSAIQIPLKCIAE